MSDPIRDSLDAAIDRVATRLVSADDDPGALQRILSSLPPRHQAGPWTFSSLMVRAVAVASVVLAVLYLRAPNAREPESRQASTAIGVLVARPATNFAELRPTALSSGVREVSVPVRALRVEPETHPFELSAVKGPAALSVPSLQSAPLAVEPTAVAPMSFDELPLSSEVPPPSTKE